MSLNSDYENFQKLDTWLGDKPPMEFKALIGYGGITVNEDIDILDMLRCYIEKGVEESCGQCFPCRNGLKKLSKRLNFLCDGISSVNDLDFLLSTAKKIISSARCDIGQTTPKALLDVIESAPHLLKARRVERKNYTSLVTAPCLNACPAHVNIPNYIEKIRIGEFKTGLEVVMQNCILAGTIGRVCERPCETACKRKENGEAVSIRNLKRYLFDRSLQESYCGIDTKSKKDMKIAIVGAGPAGLSCAYFLAEQGYSVTIFEKHEKSGGMAKYGIPDYRLPEDILMEEVVRVQALGVEILYGVDIGKDLSIDDLKQKGYSAVFIGSGAPKVSSLRCEGEDECTSGLVGGIDYLSETARGNKIISGNRVLVIGGGNVAMDCVRTARRHGFEDVHIIYRRTEEEMPADKFEIHEAKLEGVHFNFLIAPQKIVHENGVVKGLLCQKMKLGEPDSSGRRAPIPIEGETFIFECDVIISAIGQKTDVAYILNGLDKENFLDKYNNLNADSITGKLSAETPLPIFGGGDCATGPSSLIAALAAGKRSAEYIDKELQSNLCVDAQAKLEHALHKVNILDSSECKPPIDLRETMPTPILDINERLKGFDEVELSSNEADARLEASRCLRCFRIIMIAS